MTPKNKVVELTNFKLNVKVENNANEKKNNETIIMAVKRCLLIYPVVFIQNSAMHVQTLLMYVQNIVMYLKNPVMYV